MKKLLNYKVSFAVITIILILSIFLIFNITSFVNGNNISSPWIEDGIFFNKNPYLGFFSLAIGWLGGLLGTISIIYLINDYKYYWILTILGQFLTIIDSIITGVFLTAISYFSLIVLLFLINNIEKLKIKEYVLYIIWGSFIVIGLFGYWIFTNEITILNIVDCFCAGLSIYGWYHITNSGLRGYILFIINDLIYTIVFIILGLYVVSCSFVIYGIINMYCLYELTKKIKAETEIQEI